MRLIDADAYDAELKRQIIRLPNGSTEQERNEVAAIANGLTRARVLLVYTPTVSAEPVIYCKGCAYGKVYDGRRFCECIDCDDVPDDCFCYYAKKIDKEGDHD